MLKFQIRPSANNSQSCASPGSSACSSPSLSSIPSSSATASSISSQQRLSQISTCSSSGDDEEIVRHRQREMAKQQQKHQRRRYSCSPSPSLPEAMPKPMAPPIPPKPDSLKLALLLTPTGSKKSEDSRSLTAEYGYLRIYTGQIKPDTDYKTLRVTPSCNTAEVIRQLVLEKLRLNLRDLNLFHLFMEIRTVRRADGAAVRSILELDAQACPLELQRCHPDGMSRFILGMDSNAILARIYDSEICPESNYKSVFISRRTTCSQVLAMLHQMCRLNTLGGKSRYLGIEAISELRLFVQTQGAGGVEALIPSECCVAGVYLSLMPGQKIVLRRVIVPRKEF